MAGAGNFRALKSIVHPPAAAPQPRERTFDSSQASGPVTLPRNERVGEPVAEGLMSKIGSLGGWSVFKVVPMAEEVEPKVLPMAELSVPEDEEVSGISP